MADSPAPRLEFGGTCPDCGARRVELPPAELDLGNDFAWRARDYDAIRIAMIEELAARFPEHVRWTPADLEVVLVEALAAALDQLSDMADRVTAEAYLETARRPESVRRLLGFIGYDAVALARLEDDAPNRSGALTRTQKLDRLWTDDPSLMERARRAGPRSVHDQRRMVTPADYTMRLEEHPIVRRAAASGRWTGSWNTLEVALVLPWPDAQLDDAVPVVGEVTDPDSGERLKVASYGPDTQAAVIAFHERRDLPLPDWQYSVTSPAPTHRMVLQPYLDAYRMAGQEVILEDAVPLGIAMDLTLEVASTYFQSEVRRAITDALGTRPGGFFEPGRLRFGEDLHASDLFQVLLGIEGVVNACLTRFKPVGRQYPDCSVQGLIRLDGLQIAVCDNNPRRPSRGFYQLTLRGGRHG